MSFGGFNSAGVLSQFNPAQSVATGIQSGLGIGNSALDNYSNMIKLRYQKQLYPLMLQQQALQNQYYPQISQADIFQKRMEPLENATIIGTDAYGNPFAYNRLTNEAMYPVGTLFSGGQGSPQGAPQGGAQAPVSLGLPSQGWNGPAIGSEAGPQAGGIAATSSAPQTGNGLQPLSAWSLSPKVQHVMGTQFTSVDANGNPVVTTVPTPGSQERLQTRSSAAAENKALMKQYVQGTSPYLGALGKAKFLLDLVGANTGNASAAQAITNYEMAKGDLPILENTYGTAAGGKNALYNTKEGEEALGSGLPYGFLDYLAPRSAWQARQQAAFNAAQIAAQTANQNVEAGSPTTFPGQVASRQYNAATTSIPVMYKKRPGYVTPQYFQHLVNQGMAQ